MTKNLQGNITNNTMKGQSVAAIGTEKILNIHCTGET